MFGSWAARYGGRPGPPPRDIDLLVAGDSIVTFDLYAARDTVSRRAGVEVNPTLITTADWMTSKPNGFVRDFKSKLTIQNERGNPVDA